MKHGLINAPLWRVAWWPFAWLLHEVFGCEGFEESWAEYPAWFWAPEREAAARGELTRSTPRHYMVCSFCGQPDPIDAPLIVADAAGNVVARRERRST